MCCIGGTSLSTPVWAGIAKLIAQIKKGRVGNMNPRIYKLGALGDASTSGLRDVLPPGNNGFNGVVGFDALVGYDLTTGWGSPDVQTFEAAFLSATISTPTPTGTATPTSTTTATEQPTPTATPTVAATLLATLTATATSTYPAGALRPRLKLLLA